MFNFKSTKLVLNLESIRDRIASTKMAARITVPADLDWWFYQEFGTASHFNEATTPLPDGVTVADLPATSHPDFYVIAARSGGRIRLPITMQWSEAWEGPETHHYGVAPKAFIRRILPAIHTKTSAALAAALRDGDYDPRAVQQALMSEIMPDILIEISTSMAESLHEQSDRDTPGKLGGQSPAEVFESSASIVDSSSG